MKTAVFDLIYLGGFILLALVRVLGVMSARKSRGGLRKPVLKMDFDTLLTLLQSLGLFFLPFAYLFSDVLDWANYPLPDYLPWAGTVLYVLGIAMLWLTHRALGSNWSDQLEILPGQSLITHGVYRRIRHPMYTAHLLAALGQCLLLGNWVAGPSFLLLQLPLYALRIPKEERLLLEHFGVEYREYMQRTGRIFPMF